MSVIHIYSYSLSAFVHARFSAYTFSTTARSQETISTTFQMDDNDEEMRPRKRRKVALMEISTGDSQEELTDEQ